jgi:aryl-alcohol dehydrogenase-like predicted oxidoreductase
MVSALGLGTSNLAESPAGEETLHRALELGIDFMETGRIYEGSEYLIGRVLGGQGERRAQVCLASKTLGRSRAAALRDLEKSLHYLRHPLVDIYQLAAVDEKDWAQVTGAAGALEGLKEARADGVIRFIGISSHSLDVLRKAVQCGEFDTIQTKYSPFDSRSGPLIRAAHSRDIGVIGMKPMGGLGMPGDVRGSPYREGLAAPALIRYALSNRCLSVCVPGVRFPWEVEENAAAAMLSPLSQQERRRLVERARRFLASSGRRPSRIASPSHRS